MRVEHIGWRDERVDKDLDAIAGAIGFIVSDLITSHEYNKWVEKQAKAERREKVGDTEYWYDEETKRWYPRVDLPAGLTLGERLVFLKNIRLSGVENIDALKEEQALKDRYMGLLNEFSRKLLRVGDTEKLNKTMLYLQMTQGADLKTKIGIMEELLQFLGEEGGEKKKQEVKNRPATRRTATRTTTKLMIPEGEYTPVPQGEYTPVPPPSYFSMIPQRIPEGEMTKFDFVFTPEGVEVRERK